MVLFLYTDNVQCKMGWYVRLSALGFIRVKDISNTENAKKFQELEDIKLFHYKDFKEM